MRKIGSGCIPIFYFLNASHDEKSFYMCLQWFFKDAVALQRTPEYKLRNPSPYQCITDMSLVIFRPCLRKLIQKQILTCYLAEGYPVYAIRVS